MRSPSSTSEFKSLECGSLASGVLRSSLPNLDCDDEFSRPFSLGRSTNEAFAGVAPSIACCTFSHFCVSAVAEEDRRNAIYFMIFDIRTGMERNTTLSRGISALKDGKKEKRSSFVHLHHPLSDIGHRPNNMCS